MVQEYWLPINALTAIMFPIIAFFEITRLQGFARTGKVSQPLPIGMHSSSSLCISAVACQACAMHAASASAGEHASEH